VSNHNTQNSSPLKHNSVIVQSAISIKSSRSALSTGSKVRQIFRLDKKESDNNNSIVENDIVIDNSVQDLSVEDDVDGLISKTSFPLKSPDKLQVPLNHIFNPYIELIRDQNKVTNNRPSTQTRGRVPNMKYVDHKTRKLNQTLSSITNDDIKIVKYSKNMGDYNRLPTANTSEAVKSKNSTF